MNETPEENAKEISAPNMAAVIVGCAVTCAAVAVTAGMLKERFDRKRTLRTLKTYSDHTA